MGTSVISPPFEVLQQGADKFKYCLVGSFTKGTLPFSKLQESAHKAWSHRGLCSILQKSARQFIIKFISEAAMNDVLARGTWYFAKQPFVLCPWGSNLGSAPAKSMPLWIKISNIPDYYWTRVGLSYLASPIGRPLSADKLTSRLNPLPFAKMCVLYNVGDPLPDKLTVATMDNGSVGPSTTEVLISYPVKPLFCSGCNSLGHQAAACPSVRRIWVQKQSNSAAETAATSGYVPPIANQPSLVADCKGVPTSSISDNKVFTPPKANDTVEAAWYHMTRKGRTVLTPVADESPPLPNTFRGLKNVDEVELKRQAKDHVTTDVGQQSLSNSQKTTLQSSKGVATPTPLLSFFDDGRLVCL